MSQLRFESFFVRSFAGMQQEQAPSVRFMATGPGAEALELLPRVCPLAVGAASAD